MGRTSAETVDKTTAFYIVLLDKSRDEIEQLGENLWRVDGSVDLDTLSDALHVELPL